MGRDCFAQTPIKTTKRRGNPSFCLIYNDGMAYCDICKGTENLTGWVARTTVRYKDRVYYYERRQFRCRKCNRERARSYYKTPGGKSVIRRALLRSDKKFPEKKHARKLLNRAVKSGKLTKSTLCQACSKSAPRIEGHHHDYTKPLEVVWLCPPCHHLAEKR